MSLSRGDTFFCMKNNKKENKIYKNKLKKILGFKPKNIFLYKNAFIHKSATYTNHENQTVNNERLEFLGDAVLDSVVSDYLYKKYPNEDEGFLTKTRSKIVNTKSLASFSGNFNLKYYLETQNDNKFSSEHVFADAFEALIGAIYLDKGYKKVKKFVEQKVIDDILNLEELIKIETNHKSRLIEWSQKKGKIIKFITTEHDDNLKLFVAKILLNDKEIAEGYGKTKKEAEQMAAHKAMKKINPQYNSDNVKKDK